MATIFQYWPIGMFWRSFAFCRRQRGSELHLQDEVRRHGDDAVIWVLKPSLGAGHLRQGTSDRGSSTWSPIDLPALSMFVDGKYLRHRRWALLSRPEWR